MLTNTLKTIKKIYAKGTPLQDSINVRIQNGQIQFFYSGPKTLLKANGGTTTANDNEYSISCNSIFGLIPILSKSKTHKLDFQDSQMTITLDNNQVLSIKLSESLFNLVNESTLTQTIDDSIIANTSELSKTLKVGNKSTGTHKTTHQPEFTCQIIDIDGNECTFVATDRFRVTKSKINSIVTQKIDTGIYTTVDTTNSYQHYVYGSNSKTLATLLSKAKQENTILSLIREDQNNQNNNPGLIVNIDGIDIFFGSSIHKNIDYNRILPAQFTHTLQFNRVEFLDAVKYLQLIVKGFDTLNNKINLDFDFSSKTVNIYCEDPRTNIKNESSINFTTIDYNSNTTPNYSQSFNANFLIDALGSFESDTININSNSGGQNGTKPVVITADNQKDTLVLISGLR